jgi:hypothetical protein
MMTTNDAGLPSVCHGRVALSCSRNEITLIDNRFTGVQAPRKGSLVSCADRRIGLGDDCSGFL